jgi:F0F1-type ATP synthase assembly protein I
MRDGEPSRVPDKEPQGNPLPKYLRYTYLGTQFFVTVGLPVFLGVWLDRTLGTTPLCVLLGLALGFGVGVYSLHQELFGKPRGRRRGGNDERRGERGPRDS